MYIPGRFRTGSRPFSTVMSAASYDAEPFMLFGDSLFFAALFLSEAEESSFFTAEGFFFTGAFLVDFLVVFAITVKKNRVVQCVEHTIPGLVLPVLQNTHFFPCVKEKRAGVGGRCSTRSGMAPGFGRLPSVSPGVEHHTSPTLLLCTFVASGCACHAPIFL